MLAKIHIICLLVVLLPFIAMGSEICDNGVDDDNDGKIDLNDEDCNCNGLSGPSVIPSFSYLPNYSFEVLNSCPTSLNQLNRAQSWEQASTLGLVDFVHSCVVTNPSSNNIIKEIYNDRPSIPASDILDGSIGFLSQSSSNFETNEYAANCLNTTMQAGTNYTLEMYIANRFGNKEIDLSIFGTPSCTDLAWEGNNCPLGQGSWELLHSQKVRLAPGNPTWKKVTFSFKPTQDINAVAIGGGCGGLPVSGGVTSNYYYADQLILAPSSSFMINPVTIEQIGSLCTNNLELQASVNATGGNWQWYKEGVALIGETNAILNANSYGYGNYTAEFILGMQCVRTDYVVSEFGEYINIRSNATGNNATKTTLTCGESTTLYLDIWSGGTPVSYAWSPNDGSLNDPTEQQPIASPKTTTTYNVLATFANGCTASENVTILVDQPIVYAGLDVSIPPGGSTTLSASTIGTGPTPTFSWYPADGLNDANSQNPIASPSSTTTYIVNATYPSGCTSSDNVRIAVEAPPPSGCTGANLVPNPGFENTTGCLNGINVSTECSGATPSSFCAVNGWFHANEGTSDLYSKCAPSGPPNVSVIGFQDTKEGNNYAGIIREYTINSDRHYAEYVRNRLTAPLIAGTTYRVTFYANLSDNHPFGTYLGAHFTANELWQNNNEPIDVVPQIETEDRIFNQIDWVKVEDTFVATGGEEYITIGSFGIDRTAPEAIMPLPTDNTLRSYYLIDQVSVVALPFSIDAGADQTITPGNSTILTATPSGGTPISYVWTPSSTLNTSASQSVTATPPQTTIYTVTATFPGGCTATDDVMVVVGTNIPACTQTVSAGPDNASVVAGSNIQLQATPTGGNPISYSWAPLTGLSDATIANPVASPISTITYTVTADFGSGCIATDQVSVTVNPPGCTLSVFEVTMDNVVATCNTNDGQARIEVAGATSFTVTWQDDQGNSVAVNDAINPTNLLPGTYSALITDNDVLGCSESISITITEDCPNCIIAIDQINTTPVSCHSGTDGRATAEIKGSDNISYLWQNEDNITISTNTQAENLTAGTYHLIVNDDSLPLCSDTLFFTISQPNSLVVDTNSQDADCGLTNGSINIAATGGVSPYTYTWTLEGENIGISAPFLNNIRGGLYHVEVRDNNGCTVTETVGVVPLGGSAPVLDLGQDRTLCQGDTLLLDATQQNAVYLWQDGSINPFYEVSQEGLYRVTVTNDCGQISDDVVVSVQTCTDPGSFSVRIANAVTPNGDGDNDTFFIENIWQYPDNYLKIFNRWGDLIYEVNGYKNQWEGTYNGKGLPTGTYYYVLELRNAERQTFKGSISVIY